MDADQKKYVHANRRDNEFYVPQNDPVFFMPVVEDLVKNLETRNLTGHTLRGGTLECDVIQQAMSDNYTYEEVVNAIAGLTALIVLKNDNPHRQSSNGINHLALG